LQNAFLNKSQFSNLSSNVGKGVSGSLIHWIFTFAFVTALSFRVSLSVMLSVELLAGYKNYRSCLLKGKITPEWFAIRRGVRHSAIVSSSL